jgi:hypothetical protein
MAGGDLGRAGLRAMIIAHAACGWKRGGCTWYRYQGLRNEDVIGTINCFVWESSELPSQSEALHVV